MWCLMCDLFYHNFLGRTHFPSAVHTLQLYKKSGSICKIITRLLQGYDVNGCYAVLFGTTIPNILRFLVPASSGVGFYTVWPYRLISAFQRCKLPPLSRSKFWVLLDLPTYRKRVSKYGRL